MLRIVNNAIKLTRGDTAYINITLTDALGETYELQTGDHIVFGVRKTVYSANYAIYRELRSPELVLNPADTAGLSTGVYRYDLELTLSNGDINTVASGEFEIEAEVVRNE